MGTGEDMDSGTDAGAGAGRDTGAHTGVQPTVLMDPPVSQDGADRADAHVVRRSRPSLLPAPGPLGLAVLRGILAYVAAWVAAVLLTLLVVLSVVLLDANGGGLTGPLQAGRPDGELRELYGALVLIPAQLVGMAFLSPLDFSAVSGTLGLPFEPSGSITFVPLAVTLASACTSALLASRSERLRPQSWGGRSVLAACSGVAAALVALILAAASTAVVAQDAAVRFTASAVSPALAPGAVVVVAGSALVGAMAASRRAQGAPTSVGPSGYLGAALRVVALHYVVVTVLAGAALLVAAGTGIGSASLLSAPAWLPTVATFAYGAVHLAPVQTAVGTHAEALTVFDLPWWGWLASLVVLLLTTLAAALAWAARTRTITIRPMVAWTALPAAYLIWGLGIMGVAHVAGSVSGWPGVTTAALGPGPWTWCILAGWGLVITLLARVAAPPVLAVWPGLARVPLLRPAVGRGRHHTGNSSPATGTDVPAGAVTGPVQAVPVRRVKALVGSGTAVLLLLIAGVVTVNLVNQSAFGPHKPVEAYLDTLVAGDAEASRSLIARSPVTGSGESAQAALLSDSVYGAAAGRLTGYQVRDAVRDGDTATVIADVTQGGNTTGMKFTVTRTGSTRMFFDEWRLDGPEPLREVTMVIPEDLQILTVNGVEVVLPPGGGGRYPGLRSVVLPALPGDYVVTPPAPSRYLSYGAEQTVSVPADRAASPRQVLLEARATPAVEADAAARVTEALAACIASTEASPSGCPNRSFMYGDPKDVRDPGWTLDREPTFTLEESYEPGVYRLASSDALATFSYERNAEYDDRRPPRWTREEDSQSLYLGATVTVTGDTIDLDLDLDLDLDQ